MNKLAEYIIPFSGMKIGNYEFNYNIGSEFFDSFEYSEIKDADVIVSLSLNKSETMMVANFDIEGTIVLECDVCLGELEKKIKNEYRQIFKFSDDEDLKLDDEITFVSSLEFQINIAPLIVEFINLSKPNKSSHEIGKCDKALVSVLDEYLLVEKEQVEESSIEEDEIDPRWNVLKKLKNK